MLSKSSILLISGIEFMMEETIHCFKLLSGRPIRSLRNLNSKIIELHRTKLTGSSIWLLKKIYGKEQLNSRLRQLRELKPGTVGREMADMLDRKQYRLIPKFEDHDLKHIVLGFEMTRMDEIRMQAYLVGNGNRTLPCIMFLSIAIIYPRLWSDLILQYQKGKIRRSIFHLRLDDCLYRSLEDVKAEYN